MKRCLLPRLKKKATFTKQELLGLGLWASLSYALIGLLFIIHGFDTDDKFGVNELGDFMAGWFAPMAFIWFVVAVFMQQDELSETRKITKLQADELKNSAKALKEQSAALKIQNFENTFFSLVESLMGIVNGMTIEKGTYLPTIDDKISPCSGRSVFIEFNKYATIHLDISKNEEHFHSSDQAYWNDVGDQLGVYFRLIHRIIKFVDEHKFHNIIGKRKYIDFLRSHLSDAELVLLFINTMSERGKPFQKYTIKYDLFDNLQIHSIPRRWSYIEEHYNDLKERSKIVNQLIANQPYRNLKDMAFLDQIETICKT